MTTRIKGEDKSWNQKGTQKGMIKRFFVVSTGRTGTRSLARTLDNIKGFKATHERLPEAREISNRRWDHEIDGNEAKVRIKNSLDEYDEMISTRRSVYSPNMIKRVLKTILNQLTGRYTYHVAIDSNCLVWNFIDLLDEVCDQHVGYIYVYRNARDTINSMSTPGAPFYRAHGSVPWEKRAKRGFIDITRPGYSERDRRKNCEFGYKIRTEQIEKSLDEVPSDRQIRIKFEKLISDGQTLYDIVKFISELSGIEVRNIPRLAHENKR